MYLDFKEISAMVPFPAVLNWLGLAHVSVREGEIKCNGAVINTRKNLYFNPQTNKGGSVINFVAEQRNISLRDAAQLLKEQFLDPTRSASPNIPELELAYCDYLAHRGLNEETTKAMEFGLAKKGSAAGKIAFRVRHNGQLIGHTLFKVKEEEWFFYKGWKNDYLWNLDKVKTEDLILVSDPFDAALIYQLGYQNVVALMAKEMTEAQFNLIISRFCMVLLLHKEPQNIVNQLSPWVFVKAPDWKPNPTKENLEAWL